MGGVYRVKRPRETQRRQDEGVGWGVTEEVTYLWSQLTRSSSVWYVTKE